MRPLCAPASPHAAHLRSSPVSHSTSNHYTHAQAGTENIFPATLPSAKDGEPTELFGPLIAMMEQLLRDEPDTVRRLVAQRKRREAGGHLSHAVHDAALRWRRNARSVATRMGTKDSADVVESV